MTWQDIATAPKDGTEILMISAKGRIADGYWIVATSSMGAWIWPYINQEPVAWMPMIEGAGDST